MHEEAQDTDDGITQMVDEKHVHDNCFVASGKSPLIPHKTHKEDKLIKKLKMNKEQLC